MSPCWASSARTRCRDSATTPCSATALGLPALAHPLRATCPLGWSSLWSRPSGKAPSSSPSISWSDTSSSTPSSKAFTIRALITLVTEFSRLPLIHHLVVDSNHLVASSITAEAAHITSAVSYASSQPSAKEWNLHLLELNLATGHVRQNRTQEQVDGGVFMLILPWFLSFGYPNTLGLGYNFLGIAFVPSYLTL